MSDPSRAVVLASGSPRRRMLLRAAGLEVEVRPQRIDETPRPGERPEEIVARLADAKRRSHGEAEARPVVAADTLVALDGAPLGQPADAREAAAMLERLSGRTHTVLTAVSVGWHGREGAALVATRVTFRPLARDEILRYVAHNQVLDKAGAYAVQEGAASFIVAIDGPLDNVVGLPVAETLRLLAGLGWRPPTPPPRPGTAP